jgi:hypothetical protein
MSQRGRCHKGASAMQLKHCLIFVAFSLVARLAVAADTAPFMVFNGLLYKNQPDVSSLGMIRIGGINPPASVNSHPSDAVDEAKVRAALQVAIGGPREVYLDYEMWPTLHVPAAEVSANIQKLKRVAQLAHDVAPLVKFGYYNVLPCWDYWGIVSNDQAKIKEWQECNVRMDEVAQYIDIVMPSLYTYYNNPQGWDIQAAALLKAARRYGKPVYAFLWPEFHLSNQLLKGKNLPGNFWRHELEFCKARADGIVIWGGWQEEWDDQAAWWIETKAFLAELKSK